MINKTNRNIPFDRMKSLSCIFNKDKKLTIFDVGANIGQTVDEMLEFFPNSIIYSFEPQPKIYQKLTDKFKDNHHVKTFNIGLSNRKDKLSLFINEANNSVSSSLYRLNLDSESIKRNLHPKENFISNNNQNSILVEVDTLDNIGNTLNIDKIDILKIDTQGHEIEVLEGAFKLLKKNFIKAIVVECTFDDLYAIPRDNAPELFKIMYKYNLFLYDISHIYKDYERNQTLWADFIFVSR
tara:strand:- start:1231 stop:1947 length:717 start_codon:yes stop_codon:yes gene_type:complete